MYTQTFAARQGCVPRLYGSTGDPDPIRRALHPVNLLSLIASCRLHHLDPEAYLRDLFCVLPQWPKGRYLELAPKYWRATRARLDDAELDREITWFTIPPHVAIPDPALDPASPA